MTLGFNRILSGVKIETRRTSYVAGGTADVMSVTFNTTVLVMRGLAEMTRNYSFNHSYNYYHFHVGVRSKKLRHRHLFLINSQQR